LIEKTISLAEIEPAAFFGANNINMRHLQNKYPKLKIVARGNELKVQGEEQEIEQLNDKITQLINSLQNIGSLHENKVNEILDRSDSDLLPADGDILLHGQAGKVIKVRTANQRKLVEHVGYNDIVFAIGPAGTGKTYTAVALAVRALKNKMVKRIILARPAVEAGENLGFLPGDLKDKIDPYLRPLYDALEDMIAADKLKLYLENRTIEVAPMAFMRGRTLDNAFIILDEAQNATHLQLKMFLTRMGPNAKVIITGDLTQIDLPRKNMSGLATAIRILGHIKGIKVQHLDVSDVVRHRLVKDIIDSYDLLNTDREIEL
jgi:phosphate starvation-inducible PhoH-like protein